MPLRQNAVNKNESSPALQPLGLLTPGSLRAWAAHPTSHGCSIISFSAYSPLESELPSWLQGWAQLSQTPAWWTRLSKAKGPFPAPKIGEAQASPIATLPPPPPHPPWARNEQREELGGPEAPGSSNHWLFGPG